jgi:hypothetical protein
MDPSHARRHTDAEIDRMVVRILVEAYPEGIRIPIDIDRLVYRHPLVDDIAAGGPLEDTFKVAGVLISKSNGRFDILVDEETFDSHRFRANFSIAHEFGHVVLHSQVCSNCRTVEDAIALRRRIENSYDFIERNANYFAGAVLMPLRTLPEDTAKVYEALAKSFGYDANLIPDKLCSTLARRYEVSLQPMSIRLKELGLTKKILAALRLGSPYLDP